MKTHRALDIRCAIISACLVGMALSVTAQGVRVTGAAQLVGSELDALRTDGLVFRTDIDSGVVSNIGSVPSVVFSTIVASDDASWIQVSFDEAKLGGSRANGNATLVRMTSLTDGAVQTLDSTTIEQWHMHSAFFNGDAVLVEVIAFPGTGPNRLRIRGGIAGEPLASQRSICGGVDDRVPITDQRVARALPSVSCSAFMINDCHHCFVSNSNCSSLTHWLQFNVPLSTPSGTAVNPPPEDQYAVDTTSKQGGFTGGPWLYFAVYPNADTGLTPDEAYGVGFDIGAVPAPSATLRVSGYGTAVAPVSPTWNRVLRSSTGPLDAVTGSILEFSVDTSPGNLGSVIIDESTGLAVGLSAGPTSGGDCDLGASNFGTGLDNPDFQAALANPLGRCLSPGPDFAYPDGVPTEIAPEGGEPFHIQVIPAGGVVPVTGTGLVHYSIDDGETWSTFALADDGTDFSGEFPALPCAADVLYYFSVEADNGERYTAPPRGPGPDQFVAVATYGLEDIANFDFEQAVGWSVVNAPTLINAGWERGVPPGSGLSWEVQSDFDGSGSCWVTGLTPGETYRHGPTRLYSPVFDISMLDDPYLTYARYHYGVELPTNRMVVEITSDGTNWVTIESLDGIFNEWEAKTFRIAQHVPLSTTFQVRFRVRNEPHASGSFSVTDSAVDAFRIFDHVCVACPFDVNDDGLGDVLDFLDFIDAYAACDGLPAPCAGSSGVDADYNGDTLVDVLDFLDFLDAFGTGC